MSLDRAAVGGLVAPFEADGDALDVSEQEGRLKAVISVAREDASAECLVPPDTPGAIMGPVLGVPSGTIDVRSP